MALFRLLIIGLVVAVKGSEADFGAIALPVSGQGPCFVNGMQVDASLCKSPPPPFPGPPPPSMPPFMPPPPPEAPLAVQAATNPYVLGAAGVVVVGVGAYAVMSRSGGVAMS